MGFDILLLHDFLVCTAKKGNHSSNAASDPADGADSEFPDWAIVRTDAPDGSGHDGDDNQGVIDDMSGTVDTSGFEADMALRQLLGPSYKIGPHFGQPMTALNPQAPIRQQHHQQQQASMVLASNLRPTVGDLLLPAPQTASGPVLAHGSVQSAHVSEGYQSIPTCSSVHTRQAMQPAKRPRASDAVERHTPDRVPPGVVHSQVH